MAHINFGYLYDLELMDAPVDILFSVVVVIVGDCAGAKEIFDAFDE